MMGSSAGVIDAMLRRAAEQATAAERARCAAVCREVAAFYDAPDAQAVVAQACAYAIERGPVAR